MQECQMKCAVALYNYTLMYADCTKLVYPAMHA